MTRHVLCIGSNAPDAEALMARAGEWLRSTFGDVKSSGVYSTPALNGKSPDYLNMVASVASELTAAEIARLGKEFEQQCGRSSKSKATGVVEMDVDLMQSGNVILRPAEFSKYYFTHGLDLLTKI